MVQRVKGFRRHTRHKLKKTIRTRGKISLTKYLQSLKEGDKVCLRVEPACYEGQYHPKYHNKVGKVVGKAGKCYEVAVTDVKKEKKLIVHPVHLTKVE
ncbi:50S ribosomal protein L21e [Nanoarchaeota archaeon]